MWMLCFGLFALCFAIYGTYAFNNDITCRIFKYNPKAKNICAKVTWIPSAIVVGIVLGIILWHTF